MEEQNQKPNKKNGKNGKKTDKKLIEMELKCEEYLQGWRRARADYENLQRQVSEEKQKYVKMVMEDMIRGILPVYNNMKLAIDHIPEDQMKEAWVVGVTHIRKQFETFLDGLGVEEIKTVGEEFDPHLHEVIEKHDGGADVGNKGSSVIKKEVMPGYKIGDRVITPAKVVV